MADDELDHLREWRVIVDDLVERLAEAREIMASLSVDASLDDASLRQIAAASGYSHQRVHQIVQAALVAVDAAV